MGAPGGVVPRVRGRRGEAGPAVVGASLFRDAAHQRMLHRLLPAAVGHQEAQAMGIPQ